MKQVSKILGIMEASLNGSLDGLELDNTDEVIEKSLVIEMVNDLKMLVNEAQTEVNKISSNSMLADSLPRDVCKKCGEPLHFAMGSLFCPNPKC